MASQRERKQAAPDHGRRHRDYTVDPYQTVGASRLIAPAFVSAPLATSVPSFVPPASSSGGWKNILEDTRRNDRAELALLEHDAVSHNYHDRAEVDQEDSFDIAPVRSDQGADSPSPACACDAWCQCKPACKYEIHSCPCAPCMPRPHHSGNEKIPPSRSLEVARQDSAQRIFRKPVVYNLDRSLPDRSFDGTVSRQKSQPTKSSRRNDSAAGGDSPQSKRQRAPTINSDLAYVPPAPTKTPLRKQKDTTPLGFYGSNSGQRYPTFNVGTSSSKSDTLSPPVFAAAPSAAEQAQTVESIAQTLRRLRGSDTSAQATDSTTLYMSSPLALFEDDDESDRRTPSPLCAPRQRRYQCNKTYAAITGEDIEKYDEYDEYPAPEFSPGPVTYPVIPRSTSAELFPLGVYTPTATQSFPSAQAGNPRDAEGIPEQACSHREDFHGRTHSIRAIADGAVPSRYSSPGSAGHGFPPPLPAPLPLPNFIAPRPATKQRYVSAGGNAKLEDRPEITGFALPPRVTQGISIPRDVFLQHLESVPHFATPKHSMDVSSPIPRGSEEVLLASSTRSSYDDGVDRQGTKRDRKESGSSQRLARFRRVFSFGKDGKDKESKDTSPS